jgi:CheY-specific phosphatase CheX
MVNMDRIEKTLLNSIFEVFEKIFFVFLEPFEQKGFACRWAASIQFYGANEGEIKAHFTEGIVESMVQNMLNIAKDDVTDTLREDCVKEAINVICGNFLRNLDSSAVFDLSLPFFEPCASGSLPEDHSHPAEDNKLSVSFKADNEMVNVVLLFKHGF